MRSDYERQTRLIRAYRWCRWVPWFALQAAVCLAGWVLGGCPTKIEPRYTKWRLVKATWRMHMSLAEYHMGASVSLDELRNQ